MVLEAHGSPISLSVELQNKWVPGWAWGTECCSTWLGSSALSDEPGEREGYRGLGAKDLWPRIFQMIRSLRRIFLHVESHCVAKLGTFPSQCLITRAKIHGNLRASPECTPLAGCPLVWVDGWWEPHVYPHNIPRNKILFVWGVLFGALKVSTKIVVAGSTWSALGLLCTSDQKRQWLS